jgi:hypothetical protein
MNGYKLVGNYILKDKTRLGSRRASLIATSVTDALYEALLVVKDENCIVIGERCTR